MYVFHLAWRYAANRLVNAVAVLTILLCVLVQVVVMAVLDGMLDDYRDRIRGLGEQVTLYLPHDAETEETFSRTRQAVTGMPGVRGITPVLERYAVLRGPYGEQPVIVRGIDLRAEQSLGRLPEYVLDQNAKALSWLAPGQEAPDPQRPGIFIGTELADFLGITSQDVRLGAVLSLEYAGVGEDKLLRRRFRVAGRFRCGIGYYDRYYAYVPLKTAQELFNKPEAPEVTFGAIWLEDATLSGPALDRMTEEILLAAGRASSSTEYAFHAATAEDAWQNVFEGMAHENALMEIVMAMISLSSGFAIFAIMYTLVAGRVRDIGILRSIGASRLGIVLIFSLAGLGMGLAGAVLGAAGGVAFAPHVGSAYEWVTGSPLYPPYLFGVKTLPIAIAYDKVVIRSLAAVLMAFLASLPPAIWAGYRPPLEALRHE
ncbi:MAG: FtsX-like permease family protein [Planctomycetota bacterium]